MKIFENFQRLGVYIVGTVLLFGACQSEVPLPKPRVYPRVIYPSGPFTTFDKDYCKFTFRYPSYVEIQQDSTFFDVASPDPCWFDMYYPSFDCRVYCSYLPVGKTKSFDQLRDDVFSMAGWHNKKANYIDEILVDNKLGAEGMAFEMNGPVASPYQFFLTDKNRTHFFRGSVYFNTQVNQDSLAPVIQFVKNDLDSLLISFRWTE